MAFLKSASPVIGFGGDKLDMVLQFHMVIVNKCIYIIQI